MKNILFKENLFNQVVFGNKTETRRLTKGKKPRYKKGDIVYLKEPYQFNYHLVQESLLYELTQKDIVYKYLNKISSSEMLEEKWKNKMFMPEKFARYFVKIIDIKEQNLHDITEKEAIKEGIEFSKPIPIGYRNYIDGRLYFAKDKMYKVDSFKKIYSGAVMSFLSFWEKMSKKNVFEENPKVYVYTFELFNKVL